MSAIKFPRNNAWLVLLCLHGFIAAIGCTVVFGYGANEILSPTSERNRMWRAPSPAELTRGERWFSGTIVALGVPRDVRTQKDPWDGCAIRRERFETGKNGGWSDDITWSNSTVIARANVDSIGAGQVAEVELHRVTPAAMVLIPFEEVREYLPNESFRDRYRYKKYCASVGAPITIDGQIDSDGLLKPFGGRLGAVFETKEQLRERLKDTTVNAAIALLAIGGPLFWLASLIGYWAQVVAFARVCRAHVGGAKGTGALPGCGAVLGLVFGFGLLTTRVPSVALLPAFFLALGAGGFVLSLSLDGLSTLKRMSLVLSGKTVDGVACESGRLQDDLPPVKGRLRQGLHAFSFLEIFNVGSKNSRADRIGVFPSAEEISAHGQNGRFTFRTSDATYVCDYDDVRMEREAFLRINPDIRRFDADQYWLRESVLEVGAAITVIGRSTRSADREPGVDAYRSVSPLHVFDAGALVLGHSPAVVKKRIARGLLIHQFFLALFLVWVAVAITSLTLITLAGFSS